MGDKYITKKGLPQYPVFHYKELEDLINSKPNHEDSVINTLELLKKLFAEITEDLKNMIDSNINNFNIQTEKYNRNTYVYLILSQLDVQLCEIIFYKLSQNNEKLLKDKIIENKYVFDKNKVTNDMKNKYEKNKDFNLVIKRVESLLDKFEKIYNSNHCCALKYMNVSFNYIICYIKEIIEQIKLFKNMKIPDDNDYKMDDEIILIDLIFMLEKLDSICIFISSGYFVDKNDVLNQEENSDDWNNISKIGYEVIFSREDEIQKQYTIWNLKTEQLICTLINSYNENSYRITNASYFIYNFIKYGGNSKLMLYESRKAQLILNKNLTKELMEMVLWPIFKKLGEKNYQNIKFRKKMYIKKEYPDISLDYIQKLLKLMGNNYIDVSNIKQEIIYKSEDDIINNKEIPKDELYLNKPAKNIKKYYVSITLLHSSYITFNEEKNTLKYSIMNTFFEYNKPNMTKDALMIFIHGGGFVGMSTHFHESFLRDWVNQLNIPIIGINYGLSPKHKYPYGINDCYQAYRWIINHCEDVIGIKPKKLILAGDSSGGSFVLSLTYLLIAKNEFENENIRMPDLIMPLYPCCNTSANIMSTSFLLSIKDFLLNDKFLLYVNEAYRDTYPNDDDPFLNPKQAKECILKKLPKTIFQFGSCDPLRDDLIRLLAKISKIQDLDVKAYEFREYNHAFYGGEKNEFISNVPSKLLFKEILDLIKE